MKTLILYCHPNPGSFNHAILESLEAELKKKHEVVLRDLYAMGFDPVLKQTDFEAQAKGSAPADVAEERKHVVWAELIVLVAPVWWAGFPALLKGYIDRVFAQGFAFEFTPLGPKGLLGGKKVLIIQTTASPESMFDHSGLRKSLDMILEDATFKFCGLEVAGHKYFFGVPTVSDKDRKAMLKEVKALVKAL